MNILYIVFAIVGFLLLSLIFIFNNLVRKRNRVEEAWSDIEVQMKRRYDLIPNVVETVKGYIAHVKGVLENVTRARAQAMGAHSNAEHAQAENMLSSTLKTLFAVAENYPDLKANANFLDSQRELADTENKIQSARRFYNSNVLDYNNKLEVFPTNVIASWFSFTREELFQLDNPDQAKLPEVKF